MADRNIQMRKKNGSIWDKLFPVTQWKNILDKPIYDVKDYGARGNGSANDTSAIQSAINAAVGTVFFPPGTYMIGAAGLVGKSNLTLRFAQGARLKLSANLTAECLIFNDCTNFVIDGAEIDQNGKSGTLIGCRGSQNFTIKNCHLKNVASFGIGLNNVSDFKIIDNQINFLSASSAQNQAIVVSEHSGVSKYGAIRGNTCSKSAMNLSGSHIQVVGNHIFGHGFGAGITTEAANDSSYAFVIADNIIHDGVGTDVNGFKCGGIENWARDSIIRGNTIHNNSGAGIDQGGKRTIVSNNMIYNNGKSGNSGIVLRYANATYNASESVITGNRCFDLDGGSGTQKYGIEEETANTEYITIADNMLKQNKTGEMLLKGNKHTVRNPEINASVNWGPVNLANGASAETDCFFPGAGFGDFVSVSASVNLQGVLLSAYINAANNVKIRLQNNTGGAVTLASGTYRVVLKKYYNFPGTY